MHRNSQEMTWYIERISVYLNIRETLSHQIFYAHYNSILPQLQPVSQLGVRD